MLSLVSSYLSSLETIQFSLIPLYLVLSVCVTLCSKFFFFLNLEIKWNASLMQLGNFIDVFLARHVSGTHGHHQEH